MGEVIWTLIFWAIIAAIIVVLVRPSTPSASAVKILGDAMAAAVRAATGATFNGSSGGTG